MVSENRADLKDRGRAMPITNLWHPLSGANSAPEAEGVYELGNSNNAVVYIGRANNLRRRLLEHNGASRTTCIGRNANRYRREVTAASVTRERELIQEYKQSHGGRLPTCNEVSP
jgi:predicted GIY-YIG superfamily endonuclease